MKFYKLAVIVLLVLFLGGFALAKNFDFFKKIPVAIFNIFNSEKTIKINKHLIVSPQKGIYSTVWTARAKRFNDLIRLADETEINAIVIDVKDSGVYLDDYIKNLVLELHQKNIYAIARIIVFQDGSQIKNHPDWYFKKTDSSLWADNRDWYWLNPTNQETWRYNVAIAKQAIDAGFDEINFDYIRFPAFSKNDSVDFPPDGKIIFKNQIIDEFVSYLTSELKKYDPNIKLSVDLFAYNMLKTDDLGVGQKFTDIYDYFDYVSPMIYPSHYLPDNFGFANPAEHPHEVVFKTIEKGKIQLWERSIVEVGTTTPAMVNPVFEKRLKKLRPWLQDFNIGAIYSGEMIRQEKQAVYDSGLTSGWLLWNPRSVYTESALDK